MNLENEASLLDKLLKKVSINSSIFPLNLKKINKKNQMNMSKNQCLIKQTYKNKDKNIHKTRNHNLDSFLHSFKISQNANNFVSKSTCQISKNPIGPKNKFLFSKTMMNIQNILNKKTTIKPCIKKQYQKSQTLPIGIPKKVKKLPESHSYFKSKKDNDFPFFANPVNLKLKSSTFLLEKNKGNTNSDNSTFLFQKNKLKKLKLRGVDRRKYIQRNISNPNINCDNTPDININILNKIKNDNNSSNVSKQKSGFLKGFVNTNNKIKNPDNIKKFFTNSLGFTHTNFFLSGKNDKENDSCNIVNISIGNISITKNKSNYKISKENQKDALLNKNENSISKNTLLDLSKKEQENDSLNRNIKRELKFRNQNTIHIEKNKRSYERMKTVKINSPKRNPKCHRFNTGVERNSIKIDLNEYYNEKKQKISLVDCDTVYKPNIPNIENENFYSQLKNNVNAKFPSETLNNKVFEIKLKTILYKKKQIESLINNSKKHKNFDQSDTDENNFQFFKKHQEIDKQQIFSIKMLKRNRKQQFRQSIIFSGGIRGGINKYVIFKTEFDQISLSSIQREKFKRRKAISMDPGSFLKYKAKLKILEKKSTKYPNNSNYLDNLNKDKTFPILKSQIYSCEDDDKIWKNPLNSVFIQNLIIRTIAPLICLKENKTDTIYKTKKKVNFEAKKENKCVNREYLRKNTKSFRNSIYVKNFLIPRKSNSGDNTSDQNISSKLQSSNSLININKVKILSKKNFFNKDLVPTVIKEIKSNTSALENNKMSNEKKGKYLIKNYKSLNDLYLGLCYLITDREYNLFMLKIEEFRGLININYKIFEGNTFLILCAREGCVELINFLCQKNCDINIQNDEGNTALHYAIANQFFDAVDVLIKYGAKEDIANLKGLSPWDCLKHGLD